MSSAIVFTEYGGPEVLRLVQAEPPTPAEGQVRVRVRAAGLQPADSLLRSGRFRAFMPARFPQRLGNELAGVVDAVGPGVENFRVGEQVLGPAAAPGAHADHALADAAQLVAKPAELDWSQAGALSASGQTAATCLSDLGVGAGEGEGEGHTVLIHGAAGGVGSMAVQIALARGARVVGTASERNHGFLRELGAVPVVYGPGLAERVRSVTDAPIDAAFDTAGTQDALQASTELVADRSRIGTVAAADVDRYGIRRLSTRRSAGQLQELVELTRAGRLTVFVHRTFGLDQAHQAYKELDSGHVRGKLVFLMP